MPAAAALLRNVALPTNPLVYCSFDQTQKKEKPNGFGFLAARNPRNVAFVQLA